MDINKIYAQLKQMEYDRKVSKAYVNKEMSRLIQEHGNEDAIPTEEYDRLHLIVKDIFESQTRSNKILEMIHGDDEEA